MGKSGIEWTDYTFNPWIGCSKVSEGCANCYAERDFSRKPLWANCSGVDGERKRTSADYWKKPLAWNRAAAGKGEKPGMLLGSQGAGHKWYRSRQLAWHNSIFC